MSCSTTMVKRMQEQKREEISVTKSKSTAMNLSSHCPTSSSSAKLLIASHSLGILVATAKLERRMRRNSKSDTASSSRARLQDENFGGLWTQPRGTLLQKMKNQVQWIFPNPKLWSFHEEEVTEKPVAHTTVTGKFGASSKSESLEGPNAERTEWSHTLYTCLQPHSTIHKQCSPSSGGSTDENW